MVPNQIFVMTTIAESLAHNRGWCVSKYFDILWINFDESMALFRSVLLVALVETSTVMTYEPDHTQNHVLKFGRGLVQR
jgi:hypothetical protein